jgi:hypothetical protein
MPDRFGHLRTAPLLKAFQPGVKLNVLPGAGFDYELEWVGPGTGPAKLVVEPLR